MDLRRRLQTSSRLIATACIALMTVAVANGGDKARPAKGGKPTSPLPIGIGVGVAVLAVAGSVAFLSTRRRPTRPTPRKAVPPPLPPEFLAAPPAVEATAICAQPSAMPPGPAPLPLAEPEPILLAPADSIQSGLPKPPLPALPTEPEASPGVLLSAGPDSRGPTRACGRCGNLVPAELGAPPWCPTCGNDLKAQAQAPARATGAAPFVQPPYFVARAKRSYRVYITPKQLLLIDCPASDDRSATENAIRGASIQGGLVGIMIGSALAGALQENRLAKARDRNWTLNLADEQELIAMAEREADSFAVDVEDLRDVAIEALTFWQHTFADRCSARLRFLHPVRGPLAFDLPRPDDVRVAIKQLTPLFGDRITVNATWDWGKNRYVPKE